MFYIKMADLIIRIHNHFDYVENMCSDYITDMEEESCAADMDIHVTREDIIKEYEASGSASAPGYCESICIYRKISSLLIKHNGFVMHAACICADGKVYAFCAKSGVGKSTHLALWKKVYGEKVKIINGDKPIVRYINGKFFVYGTPWCGKEGWNINTRGELYAICFLRRENINIIERMQNSDAVKYLASQILIPRDGKEIADYFTIIDAMLRNIPCYSLGCNMDEEAAKTAYEGMKDGK